MGENELHAQIMTLDMEHLWNWERDGPITRDGVVVVESPGEYSRSVFRNLIISYGDSTVIPFRKET